MSKITAYITRDQIFAKKEGSKADLSEYNWDSSSLSRAFGKIKKKLGGDRFKIILGNDLSYTFTVITEKELTEKYNGKIPDGKIVLKDRIADALFQQLLLRPSEYDIIVAPNLNGDYISDACAAQVGGLGMAPGGNINFNTHVALFEATHGSAPKHAGKNEINPGSIILSGAEMFEYMGWDKVKKVIIAAIEKTIQEKYVTYDLARQIDGATKVSTSDFGNRIIKNMEEI